MALYTVALISLLNLDDDVARKTSILATNELILVQKERKRASEDTK